MPGDADTQLTLTVLAEARQSWQTTATRTGKRYVDGRSARTGPSGRHIA